MPTLAERFIEKRSKMSGKLKEFRTRFAGEEEFKLDDDLIKENGLNDVPLIFIGDHSFTNNQIVTLFTPDNKKVETLVLFKKVFQNKYPITRHNGIPRVPSREEDKNLLVDGLTNYFNILRSEIISLKKKGDSVELREKIAHLQKINILITHFNEDKETFPYQDFYKYLSNKDYINSIGDIDEGLRLVKGEENEEERVRNLLRQFIKVYLQDKKAQDYGVHGDGIYSEQFQEFREEYKGKIPQIFIYLMEILEGEKLKVPEKSEYDFTSIYKKLEDLRNKFAEAEMASEPEFPTQSGGLIPDVKKENLEDTIQQVVDYMIEEYIKLKTGYDSVLRESLTKDAIIASLKTTISKKSDTISKALKGLKERREKIDKLDEAIKKYLEELSRKNAIIRKLVSKCKSKGISGVDTAILPSGDNDDKPPFTSINRDRYKSFLDNNDNNSIQLPSGDNDDNPPFTSINRDRYKSFLDNNDNNSIQLPSGDNPNPAREIVSNIASLSSPKRIELIEDIRNSPSINNSVNILKDFYKKQQFIDQDWSPEIFDSVLKQIIEKLKKARDTKAADKIFTEPRFRIRVGKERKPIQQDYNNDGTTVWGEDNFDRTYPENYYNPETQENLKRMEQEKKNNNNSSFSGVRRMFNPEFEEEPEIDEPEQPETPTIPSVRERPTTEWILKNVGSKGNCFYEALYNSALRYYGGSIVSDIYECFGINNGVENQEQFIRSIRNSLGDKILAGIYDQKVSNTNGNNQGIYETLHDAALTDVNGTNPNSGQFGTFVGTFMLMREGFTREIKNKYPNAQAMANETKEKFYKFLSDIVKTDGVYASQYDIDLVKWILNKCNSPIHINIENNETIDKRQKDLDSIPKYRTLNGKRTLNLLNKEEIHYNYFYEKPILPQPWKLPPLREQRKLSKVKNTEDNALNIGSEVRVIDENGSIINEKRIITDFKNERTLGSKTIFDVTLDNGTVIPSNRLITYREYEARGTNFEETESNIPENTSIPYFSLEQIRQYLNELEIPPNTRLTQDIIRKQHRTLLKKYISDEDKRKILNEAYQALSVLPNERLSQFGGSKDSKLLEYSRKVADNRLKEFLKEEPLPLFTLIEEFENSSNLKVVEKGNEKHIFETFLNYMFDQFFSSEEGKQFYFEAYEILNKKKYFDTAALCFVVLENINAIQSSRKDIDTVRMSSSEYNAMFDDFEQTLRKADYDFFTEASKLVPNKTSIKFFEDHIYFHNNTDSFEKTYTINNNLDIDKEHYDFNEELYFVNNSTIYLFFIISSYLYMKPNVKLSLEDSINKFSRKMKRTKNKKTKSIKTLLKERKEFNNEELDGEEN